MNKTHHLWSVNAVVSIFQSLTNKVRQTLTKIYTAYVVYISAYKIGRDAAETHSNKAVTHTQFLLQFVKSPLDSQ